MNALALERIVKDMDIKEKISLVELILADIKQQSSNLVKKNDCPDGNKKKNIVDFEFCGIWENNSVLANSTEFIRNIRTSEFRI